MFTSLKIRIISGILTSLLFLHFSSGTVMAYDVQSFIKNFVSTQVKQSNQIINANKYKLKTITKQGTNLYETIWLGSFSIFEKKTGLNEENKPYHILKNNQLFRVGLKSGITKGTMDVTGELYSLVAKIPTAPERTMNFGFNFSANPQKYRDMMINGTQAVVSIISNPSPLYQYGKNIYSEAAKDPLKFGILHGEAIAISGSFLLWGTGITKTATATNKISSVAKLKNTVKAIETPNKFSNRFSFPELPQINLGFATPTASGMGISVTSPRPTKSFILGRVASMSPDKKRIPFTYNIGDVFEGIKIIAKEGNMLICGKTKLYENTIIKAGEDINAPINLVRLTKKNGLLYDELDKPIHGGYLFAIDHKKNFLMTSFGEGKYHTQLVKGKPLEWAGEIVAINGEIRLINNFSGHYLPLAEDLEKFWPILQKHLPGITKNLFDPYTKV